MINSLESFKNFVYEETGNEYEVTDTIFKNMSTKILIKHNLCGYEYLVLPSKFKSGRRCPKCAYKIRSQKIHQKTTKTLQEFKQEVYDLVKDEYIVKSDKYINNKDKLLFLHTKCNKEFWCPPNKFLRGQRCKYCYNQSRTKTQEQFELDVLNKMGKEYKVLGSYITNKDKIEILHTKCNNNYFCLPRDILQYKGGCPFCKESYGEKKIRKLLKENNIDFESQFSIKDCKNIHSLKFDFKINYTDGSFLLLEYDGELHFEPKFGIENLNKQKINDEIKNKYCNEHNIPLIRINYKDYNNIEKILKNLEII